MFLILLHFPRRHRYRRDQLAKARSSVAKSQQPVHLEIVCDLLTKVICLQFLNQLLMRLSR